MTLVRIQSRGKANGVATVFSHGLGYGVQDDSIYACACGNTPSPCEVGL